MREAARSIFDQCERLDREAVARVPDGTYEAYGHLDSDRPGGSPVPVKVSVTVAGDELTLDLTGSSPQTGGCLNCGLAQTISGARLAFKFLFNPDTPVTGGTFRNFRVIAEPGSVFDAREPAACQYYYPHLGLMIDLMMRALAPALPDVVVAGQAADPMNIMFTGRQPGTGERFVCGEATAVGWGAYAQGDGTNGLINYGGGDLKNFPVEVIESLYPIRIHRYGLWEGSGGAGRTRGGLGVEREYETLAADIGLSLWFERTLTPGQGLFGGEDGRSHQRPRRPRRRAAGDPQGQPAAAARRLAHQRANRRRRWLRGPRRARPRRARAGRLDGYVRRVRGGPERGFAMTRRTARRSQQAAGGARRRGPRPPARRWPRPRRCGTRPTGSEAGLGHLGSFSNIAETPTLDPAVAFSSDGFEFVRNVYEGLLEYVPGGVNVRPLLATSWKVSPDGKTYTFTLRKGVKFQDGSPFNAAAAKLGLDRMKGVNQGPATLMANVVSVTAKGANTLVIKLKQPDVYFLGKLPKLPIVSSQAINAHKTASRQVGHASGSARTPPAPARTSSTRGSETPPST